MYESLAGSSYQSYSILTQYHRQKMNLKESDELDRQTSMLIDLTARVLDRSYAGQSSLYSSYYYSSMAAKFHYIATTDDLPTQQISMNGMPVTRTASLGIMSVEVPFATLREGRVCYLPGDCPVVRCQVDGDGVPFCNDGQTSGGREYHSLKDNPAFMFQVDDPAMTVERLSFQISYMPQSAQAYLYNGEDWVEYEMDEMAAEPQQYLDDQGRIFLQIRSRIGIEDYQEILTPSMLLEGSVSDNAEN